MSESKQSEADSAQPELWVARRDHELRARFEQLRALNSAWTVLAPLGLTDEGLHIVETGRAVSAELAKLAGQSFENRNRDELPKLDKLLEVIEREMLALALDVSVAQLRSTLPGRLPVERRGVLDLLDLMLVPEIEEQHESAGRISAIDYLITLLCTAGTDADRNVPQDPIGLTPRLYALCERAGEQDHPELAEIEAEFYAASDVSEGDARDEVRLRVLRQRKRELGASFFAPRVLRAVVTYNAALSRCIHHGVWDSRDWGSLPRAAARPDDVVSVFETEVLPRLAEALRRRAADDPPTTSAIDRVAWCLDLASLEATDRAALLSPSTGRPQDLAGTAVLVGLLCRSAIILEGEFPAIGIAPETLSAHWVRELDAALQREVNERIAGDAYQEACVLSELRTRFLYSLKADVHRDQKPTSPRAEPMSFKQVEKDARQFAHEALDTDDVQTSPLPRQPSTSRRSWPWPRVARIASVGAIAGLLILGLAWILLPGGDLDSFSGADLERVSPYLARGLRNGEGRGPAFVGTLSDGWSGLGADQQQQAAATLVAALRVQGVREIMVYDDQRRLRIQALGQQPVHVLPAPTP